MRRNLQILCFATLLAGTTASLAATAEPKLVEGIVARVNDRIITTQDMRDRIRERAAETGAPVPPDAIPALIQEAADELVLVERATELKLEVDEKEIDATVAQIKATNHITDDKAFAEQLARMGITMTQLRDRLRVGALVQKVMTKELGTFNITEEELRQRYEREKNLFLTPATIHLEHIVYTVPADAADSGSVMERARRLVAAARAGGDFAALVKGEVAAGGASGGDLGSLALDDLRPEVRTAAESLADGAVSEPFTSPAGIHVVHVLGRTAAAPKPFEAVKDELRDREMSERYRGRLKDVVEQLKKRCVVEIHPELFKEASAQ